MQSSMTVHRGRHVRSLLYKARFHVLYDFYRCKEHPPMSIMIDILVSQAVPHDHTQSGSTGSADTT